MKYTNLDEEIEQYETPADKLTLGIVMLIVLIAIVAIIYRPDVEAIGTWISSQLN